MKKLMVQSIVKGKYVSWIYMGTSTFIPKSPPVIWKGRNATVIEVRAFIIWFSLN